MTVFATAGHVNHGKTTLVAALTGRSGDRLHVRDQRARTIDLGFSPMNLPSGDHVSVVDVPGHESYVNNAIDGILPASACLLVVSAREGWCQQTEQHAQVLAAIRNKPVLLVVTQMDKCDPEPAVVRSIDNLEALDVHPTWHGAVSGVTGEGLDGLRNAMGLVSERTRPIRTGRVRLWVDRSFTVQGAGTVVTTTLGSGSLRLGDNLKTINGQTARVRSIQTFGADQQVAEAATRVALNLPGIESRGVSRGSWLVTPDAWPIVNLFDAEVNVRLDRQREATLNLGGSRTRCVVRPLGRRHVRVSLERPLPLQLLDRFILRIDALNRPIVGGQIVEVDPRPLSRTWRARQRSAQLETIDGTSSRALLEGLGAVRAKSLPDEADSHALGLRRGSWVFSPPAFDRWSASLSQALSRARAVPIDPLLTAEMIPDDGCLELLNSPRAVARAGDLLRARSSLRESVYTRLQTRLIADPFNAPTRNDLTALGVTVAQLTELAGDPAFLVLPDSVLLGAEAPRAAIGLLRRLGQPFTASSARTAFGASRRTTLALLHYLDDTGKTKRLADDRRELVLVDEGGKNCQPSA